MIISQPGYPDLRAGGWADAARLYRVRRDRSRLGANDFPEARILVDRVPVARISYNGRIWPPGASSTSTQPFCDDRRLAA